MNTIELRNGTLIEFKPVTKDVYSTLLKDSVDQIYDIFKEKYNADVYKLKNGNILVSESGNYSIFSSIEDVNKVFVDFYEAGGGQSFEILQNKNPYNDKFPHFTGKLINDLMAELKIETSKVDDSLISKVDRKLAELNDADRFKKTHLIHFVALIGEAINAKYNSKWIMELASDGITWNPYLKVKSEKIQFLTYLYEDVFLTSGNTDNVLIEVFHTVDNIIEFNILNK